MKRGQRGAHRLIWTILILLLPILVWIAWDARNHATRGLQHFTAEQR
jgi:hypothetical protein